MTGVVVAGVVGILLAGCSQSGSQPPRWSTEVSATATSAVTSAFPIDSDTPLGAYGLRPEEEASIEFAEKVLIGECMRDSGFTYPIESFSTVVETTRKRLSLNLSRRYGITDAAWAAEYGYGLPLEAFGAVLAEEDEEETEASLIALVGREMVDKMTSVGSGTMEVGGCVGQARQKLKFAAEFIPEDMAGSGPGQPGDLATALGLTTGLKLEASTQWAEVVDAWVGCMVGKGWQVADPLKWDGDIGRVTAQRGGDPSAPASEEEKRLAVDDVACKVETDLVNRLRTLNNAWEQKVVEENLLALQESRKHLDEVVAVANSVVERAG